MKTITEILDRESSAAVELRRLQSLGSYTSPEYKAARAEYKSALRARQKFVRETKKEVEILKAKLQQLQRG